MGFTIPNSTVVPTSARYGNGVLATPFFSDFNIIEQGGEGTCVVSGLQLVAGTNVGTVKLSLGRGMFTSVSTDVVAQDNIPCCANADLTNPRWALYEVDQTNPGAGTPAATPGVQINLGAAALIPVPPTPTTGRVVVAAVLIPPGATIVDAPVSGGTAISDSGAAKIIDKRWFRSNTPDYALYQPIYTTINDAVMYANATTVAAGSNGVNLNTLVGSQSLSVASTVGFPTKGAFRVTHGGLTFCVSYNGTSGNNTFLNCTMMNPSSVVLATGDAVSNAAIVTSATAAFNTNNAAITNSYVTGSSLLPQNASAVNNMATIANTGDAGANGSWADLTFNCTGSGTAQTITYAQQNFTWAKPSWARYIRVILIGAAGGGGAGSHATNATTAAHGGGGGGQGGVTDFTTLASGFGATASVVAGMGGPGGIGTTTNANGNLGASGFGSTFDNGSFGAAGGGGGGGGASGGGTGGTAGATGNVVGSQSNWVRNGVWSAPSTANTAGKGADGTAPAVATKGSSTNVGPGSGGGGGGNSAGSALQAAASGGGGALGVGGALQLASGAGGAGGANANGANGGDVVSNGIIADSNGPVGGGGGGGGGGANALNGSGGNGGNGGRYGAGGGGGGCGNGTGKAGNGGAGADGVVLIIAMP